ncbi:hypothetical protein ES702_00257 [subsurface metagenome]
MSLRYDPIHFITVPSLLVVRIEIDASSVGEHLDYHYGLADIAASQKLQERGSTAMGNVTENDLCRNVSWFKFGALWWSRRR